MRASSHNPIGDYFESQTLSAEACEQIATNCRPAVNAWRLRTAVTTLPVVALVGLLFWVATGGQSPTDPNISTAPPAAIPLASALQPDALVFLSVTPHGQRCPACSRAHDVLAGLEEESSDDPGVRYLNLDFSNEESRVSAESTLEQLKLRHLGDSHSGHLIAAVQDGKVLQEFPTNLSNEELIDSLKKFQQEHQ
ncbi:MAG: hypothetical protein AAF591_08900 [Verrucomicrobiota bacterium]